MIKWLKIQNYAIIEDLEVDFSNGLTIITGETGAGKSILLGALGLLMGNRMDTKALYDQTRKCIIEGCFDISKYDLQEFFEQHDLDYDKELFIRRELTPSGKSRAFANDSPVHLKVLNELSASLLDVHQQFDTQDIHTVELQLKMVDALANNKVLLKDYQKLYRAYKKNKRALSDLLAANQRAQQESDFLNFQLNELLEAELQTGEQESQEEELAQLTNAEDIKRIMGNAFNYLTESEQSIVSQLQSISLSINSISKFDKRVARFHEKFEGLIYEIQDLAGEFEQVAEDVEFNPTRITEVQERLDILYRLEKKHNVASVEELLQIQEELQSKQDAFGDLSSQIEALEQKIEEQESKLKTIAQSISEKRKVVAPKFEKNVERMLHSLAMEHARMKIELSPAKELTALGADDVAYLFAANKGSRLQPIKEVASGGEQSRIALVTKSLVASAIPLPTLVFDEIDSGVSGYVALKMGEILRQLSNEHQVVSITHSPQVASRADTHYYVYKRVKNERTVTQVKALTEEERVHAIAVMLSSDPPSPSAILNARELLGKQEELKLF